MIIRYSLILTMVIICLPCGHSHSEETGEAIEFHFTGFRGTPVYDFQEQEKLKLTIEYLNSRYNRNIGNKKKMSLLNTFIYWLGEGELQTHVFMYFRASRQKELRLASRKRWLSSVWLVVTDLEENKTIKRIDLSKEEDYKYLHEPSTKMALIGPSQVWTPSIDIQEIIKPITKNNAIYRMEIEVDDAFYNGIEPRPGRVYTSVGYIILKTPKNKREKAIRLYRIAQKHFRKDKDAAVKGFIKAISLDPSLQTPRNCLAATYEARGDYKNALRVLKDWKAMARKTWIRHINERITLIKERMKEGGK
jgi:tetratricopeptide (TPR) repeat protein